MARDEGRGEEKEGFSRTAGAWRFDIGLVTFFSDRQVLNSAN